MSTLDRPMAPDPYELLPQVASFTVTSPSFADGSDLPEEQAYAGGNSSPALAWEGAPAETAGYVVTCFDPDAPTPSGFWHWLVVGLPAGCTGLPAGAGAEGGAELPEGATMLVNDYGTRDFGGAAPPAGDRPHRYMFAVHALDTADLGLDGSESGAKLSFTMLEHTLARAVTTGRYATTGA